LFVRQQRGNDKQRYAREQLVAAGLESFVNLQTGDARDVVASLSGSFDFVLIDLWKDLYIPCFDLVYPKLSGHLATVFRIKAL
jgi:predicted O-methyltransferase YrrM